MGPLLSTNGQGTLCKLLLHHALTGHTYMWPWDGHRRGDSSVRHIITGPRVLCFLQRLEWKRECSRLARLLLRSQRAALLGLSVPTGISASLASPGPSLGTKRNTRELTAGPPDGASLPSSLPAHGLLVCAARSTSGAWCAQQDRQGEEHRLHRSGIGGLHLY